MNDPDERQALLRDPIAGDDNPAALTAYQAQKCAAIVDAYNQGHDGWSEHVRTVVKFLHAAAIEGATKTALSIRPSTADLWPILDALPWPPAGSPAPQPDAPQ